MVARNSAETDSAQVSQPRKACQKELFRQLVEPTVRSMDFIVDSLRSSAREFCTATCSAEGIHDARRFVIHLLIGELLKLIGEGEGVHESWTDRTRNFGMGDRFG